MCGDCGCEEGNKEYFAVEETTHHVTLDILQKNKEIAHNNHHWFHDHHVMAVNMMSSPGSGKTFLLEKTFQEMRNRLKMAVLVGDQQTDRDAQRLAKANAKVKQIATLNSCHLDASMIQKEFAFLHDDLPQLLFIENVGNLVCPSAFDLGENIRIALLSVTEGEDKPIKYPVLFHKADLVVITKMDLAPYLDWNEDECVQFIRQVNPKAKIIKLSAKTAEGMNEWFQYLEEICV
jgi:hydrogenase nickel incorporation protein HypB